MRSHFLRAASPKGGGGGGGWTPAEITTSLWLDAADASSITLNGSNVSEWRDKSGNGRHLVQATAGDQPLYTGSINGESFITFAGDYLATSGNTPMPLIERSVFLVFRASTTSFFLGLLSFCPTAGDDWTQGGAVAYDTGDLNNCQATARGGAYKVVSAQDTRPTPLGIHAEIKTAGQGQLYVSGSLRDTDSSFSEFDANSAGIILVGARYLGSGINRGYDFQGDYCEIICCPSALLPADREIVEGYLAHKWGLEANLPEGHPYKSSPP